MHISVAEEQIKAKYRYLRDIFVKANKLVEENKDLTYLQKCIYQRMYYLKPFISATTNKDKSRPGNYELKSGIKTKETASHVSNQEIEKYLKNTKNNVSSELVNILCETIEAHEDTRTQRLIFYVILRSIRAFKESLEYQQ